MANQTVDDANVAVDSNGESEKISDSFLCCICLDLLYKPIVLSCGHISCFWCVYKSMSSLHESRCPICRRTYNHFPIICVLLHQLLLKMYPSTYKMREKQMLDEEKSLGFFSPQFDNHASGPLVDNELYHLSDSVHSSRIICDSTSKGGSHEKVGQLESASLSLNNGTTKKSSIGGATVMEKNLRPNELNNDEEKRLGFFSPQFDNHDSGPLVDNEIYHLSDSVHSSGIVFDSTSKGGNHEKVEQLESASLSLNNGTTKKSSIGGATVTEKNLRPNELNGNCKQISIADALCIACKQLLIHPVVLNCGHVYCETCITVPTERQLKCEVCQCLNPNGFPKVCLELDQFLKERFHNEYALRTDAVQLKKVQLEHESGTTCSKGAGQSGFISFSGPRGEHLSRLADPHSKVHVRVGCDSCGMFPIIGERYKCKDCIEASGFDLCGDCYRTESKLPGRFNQQHTSEHRLVLVKSNIFSDMMMRFVTGPAEDATMMRFVTELVEDGSTDDDFEETGSPSTLPYDAQESNSSDLTTAVTNSDNSVDQNNTESTG